MTRVLRLAIRSLWRSPGFAVSAVVCIAIAIALSTSMVAILDAVKHPYVPYRDPDRLVSIYRIGGTSRQITAEDWRAVLGSASFVEEMTLIAPGRGLVTTGDYADDNLMARVAPDFFSLLGVRPTTGRFHAATGDDDAVVISEGFGRAAFPGTRSPVGSTLAIEGRTYTVIGVAPTSTWFANIWLPAPPASNGDSRSTPRFNPIVRLKPGIDHRAAEAELDAIAKRLEQTYGGATRPLGLRMNSLRPDPLNFRRFHAALALAGVIVLLVAGGNVANLLLARALERRPEHVLRIALGAAPAVVARHAIAESLVLAVVGCAGGVLLATWCMNIVAAYRPTHLRWLGVLDPHLSWRVLTFAALASVLTAFAAAILPMLRIARVDPGEVLKAGAATMTRVGRRRDGLVIGQLALALVLLFCSGLLAKSAVHVQQYDFGYDAKPLARAEVYFLRDSVNTDSAFRELMRAATHLPGVEAASLVGSAGLVRGQVTADEHDGARGTIIKRSVSLVDPTFFRTLRVPVIAGRDFQPGDEASGAAIVDQEAARKLWRGDSVVGRFLKLGDHRSDAPWVRVVGVIGKAHLGVPSDPDLPPEPGVFVVRDTIGRGATVVVRSRSPAIAANGLRHLLRDHLQLRGRKYYSQVGTWTADVESRVSSRWFMAALFGVFAAFTLMLALAGMYGTLSYSVSRRLREFGVRSALGATDAQLRGLVLRQAAIAILAATAIGGPVGIFTARLLDTWLYDVWYSDVTVLLAAEAVLIVSSFLVCMPVMRRTARLDPVRLLREL